VLEPLPLRRPQPLMMADSTNPAHLSLADGLATYSGTLLRRTSAR
jgi:hypothetical protein